MNKKNNAIIHALLNKNNLMSQKQNMIIGVTKGRTESARELSVNEQNQLIDILKFHSSKNDAKRDVMRKKLIALGHNIGEHPSFVKNWCKKYGVSGVKKGFNEYNENELYKLIEKFKKVVNERVAG